MVPAIIVENLCKRYRSYNAEKPYTLQEAILGGFKNMSAIASAWALEDVSFTLERGQTLGIVGNNGAGKSTLLLLLGGIIKPDRGAVYVNGRISALYEPGASFHPELSGRDNAHLAGVVSGLTRREIDSRLCEIIEWAELGSVIDRPLRTYSSGMIMRLGFSVAVHVNTDLLLVDECLAVGDLPFRDKCTAKIESLRENGCSIVLISHDLTQVTQSCDRAIWLNHGHIVAEGIPQEVVQAYSSHGNAIISGGINI